MVGVSDIRLNIRQGVGGVHKRGAHICHNIPGATGLNMYLPPTKDAFWPKGGGWKGISMETRSPD